MGDSTSSQRTHVLLTTRGSLTGIEIVDDRTNQPIYRRYARIRYAMPPTGERRWKKPQALPPDWIFSDGNNRPRDYSKFGAICPQLQSELHGPANNEMSEDCLFLNIWVPAGGEGSAGGWPVQFMMHEFPGGDYNSGHGMQAPYLDPIDLFRENRDSLRIIISANFRVGVFGFLASEEFLPDSTNETASDQYAAPGNFGLWDIRMALEWTYVNIHLFGGNNHNISAGGSGQLAAHQLHFDAFQESHRRVLRRAFLFSGALAIQPDIPQSEKPRTQYVELCKRFNIDGDLPPEDRVRLLRGVNAEKLLEFSKTVDMKFKPVTDGQGRFVPTWLMKSIRNGNLGRRLKAQKVQVLIGDPSTEAALYWYWSQRHREQNLTYVSNRQGLKSKLASAYPPALVDALLAHYQGHGKTWNTTCCQIFADVQCHATVRGFVYSLFHGGMTTQDVFRYQIGWRPKTLAIEPDTGLSHVMDIPIWWYAGWRMGFGEKDREHVLNFTQPFGRFIQGKLNPTLDWGTEDQSQVRLLDRDGSVRVAEDSHWKPQMEAWAVVRDAQLRRDGAGAVKTQQMQQMQQTRSEL